jgi:hypothetical protein
MASKINNLFKDTTFLATLIPDEVISLRELGLTPKLERTLRFSVPKVEADTSPPSEFAQPANPAAPTANEVSHTPDHATEDELPSATASDDLMPLPDAPGERESPDDPIRNQSDADRLKNITVDSLEVLLSVETVLPPMIHPSKLIVDRQKLTIVHRTFWGSTDTVSVQMDDINNVEAFIGPFFGEIRIYSKYFINNVQSLPGLWRNDAIAVRRLIQGYMIAHNKGIDCSAVEKEQLLVLLTELGRGSR